MSTIKHDAVRSHVAASYERAVTRSHDDEQARAVVPLPETLRREPPRSSFWRRIAGRARGSLTGAVGDNRLLARIDALEQSLCDSIRQLDLRLRQVWEVEEQLSQLMDLQQPLGEFRDQQSRLETRLRGIERRLSLLLLAIAALVAAVLVLLVAG